MPTIKPTGQKDSDQPVHLPSMAKVRVLLYPSLDSPESLDCKKAHAIGESSDQTTDALSHKSRSDILNPCPAE